MARKAIGAASKEAAKPQRKPSAKLPSKPRAKENGNGPSRLPWREDVLDRTREGGGDGRRVRMNVDIEDELGDSVAVTDIDEDEAAVVARLVIHPAVEV